MGIKTAIFKTYFIDDNSIAQHFKFCKIEMLMQMRKFIYFTPFTQEHLNSDKPPHF